ncbi:MAG: glycosyltransferase family 39 protein [Hydrogenophilales bacterium]|nr:glycosyltransferase family 39 protein [Hydrogenophilales bacterium]
MRVLPLDGVDALESPRKFGLLLLLCVAWLLPGLVGHAPWRPDEAGAMGIVQHILNTGKWLAPTLAGEPDLSFGPLYYWTAALFAQAFSWALPVHDAARLASGFYVALTLGALGFAARESFGPSMPRLALALMIGSVGLLAHAHEMITDTALLAGYALVLWGLALSARRANPAGVLIGAGLGIAFLARSVVPVAVIVMTAALLLAFPAWRTRRYARTTLIALVVSLPFLTIWPWLLHHFARAEFFIWWRIENLPLLYKFSFAGAKSELVYFLRTLPWFAWPVLPIALWSLWGYRNKLLREPGFQLPLVFFGILFAVACLNAEKRDIHLLPILLPLTLLAVPGAETLRRGAANALGWFGIMTFGLFSAFIWFAWAALMSGHPERFYRHVLKLQPGFVPSFEWLAFVAALLLTVLWLLPLRQSFRSGRRAVFHWAAGITLMWGLAATLLLPWIDHGKRYTDVVLKLQRHLPSHYKCIGSAGLGEPQRGALYYHAGIVTKRAERAEFDAYGCDVFLLQTDPRKRDARPGAGWVKLWQGSRPGDKSEAFALYRLREPRP